MNSQAHDVLSGRDPELSSTTGTLWALAWSDEPESLAEPVPYIGGDDAAPQSGESRFRLPTLLFGIAAGAAIAVGGLALTLGGSETQPAPAVTTEAVQSVMTPSTPATVGSPATQSVPRVANVPQRVKNSSNPAVAAAPASAPPATIAQNAGTRPAPAAPAPTAPATAPVTIMVAPPPPAAPPVITPPVVSIPDLSPLPLIHPVGPSGFGIPSVPVAPNPVVSPVLKEPIVTAAPDPVITLPTDVTLTPFAPALP